MESYKQDIGWIVRTKASKKHELARIIYQKQSPSTLEIKYFHFAGLSSRI